MKIRGKFWKWLWKFWKFWKFLPTNMLFCSIIKTISGLGKLCVLAAFGLQFYNWAETYEFLWEHLCFSPFWALTRFMHFRKYVQPVFLVWEHPFSSSGSNQCKLIVWRKYWQKKRRKKKERKKWDPLHRVLKPQYTYMSPRTPKESTKAKIIVTLQTTPESSWCASLYIAFVLLKRFE